MKVIHIVSNKFWGGGERYILDLSRQLRESGCDVEIVARNYHNVFGRFIDGAFTVSIAPLRGFIDFISPRRIAKIINICHDGQVIIHCHNFKDAITALRAKRMVNKAKVGVVVTRHLVRPAKNGRLHRFVYEGVDRVIFVSQIAMDKFLSTNPRIDRRKLSVVHNSVLIPLDGIKLNDNK